MRVNIGPYPSELIPIHKLTRMYERSLGDRAYKEEQWTKRDRIILGTLDKIESALLPINSWWSNRERHIYIQIDKFDTWNAHHTLTMIIHPMLVQLKKDKHGAPCVDDDDVPIELRSTSAKPKENDWDVDEFHFQRWDWVLDEMIWAFCFDADECEERHSSGEIHFETEKTDGNLPSLKFGPNHTFEVNRDAVRIEMERAANGRRLFAKYYLNLWD